MPPTISVFISLEIPWTESLAGYNLWGRKGVRPDFSDCNTYILFKTKGPKSLVIY